MLNVKVKRTDNRIKQQKVAVISLVIFGMCICVGFAKSGFFFYSLLAVVIPGDQRGRNYFKNVNKNVLNCPLKT